MTNEKAQVDYKDLIDRKREELWNLIRYEPKLHFRGYKEDLIEEGHCTEKMFSDMRGDRSVVYDENGVETHMHKLGTGRYFVDKYLDRVEVQKTGGVS